MKRAAVFFDRDNTLIANDGYLGDPNGVVLVEGAADAIARAREMGLRAVTAISYTNNLPAAKFLLKGGLDLCGVDTHYGSNHDLVKEAVALFWYAALD